MNERELKKLSRADLLELLIAQVKENEQLTVRLAEKECLLRARQLTLEKAGSIAQASLELSGVFQAAQAAADQYLESIRALREKTAQECRQMLEDTRARCSKAEQAAASGEMEEL